MLPKLVRANEPKKNWKIVIFYIIGISLLLFAVHFAFLVPTFNFVESIGLHGEEELSLLATSTVVQSSRPRSSNDQSVSSVQTPKGSTVVFGFAPGGPLLYSQKDLTAMFKDMKSLGAAWIRFDVDWSRIQANSATEYDWDSFDRVINTAKKENLNPLGLITYTPKWARSSECEFSDKCAPADIKDFSDFAAAVATRGVFLGMHTWEIWNEPNGSDFWEPGADPVQYAQLLKETYRKIKSVDPTAVVIIGGLARQGNANGNMDSVTFVQNLYENGAQGSFDAIALHPYSFPYLPNFPTGLNAWSEIEKVHKLMILNGDGSKKIWVTEYGAPTNGPGILATHGNDVRENAASHVSEAIQATFLSNALTSYETYDYVGPFFWFGYKDSGVSTNTVENFFGILRHDGSQKPAYNLLKQMSVSGTVQ